MSKKSELPEEQSAPYVYEKPLKAAPETASKARVISTNLASVGAVIIASQILIPANAETVQNSQPQTDGVSLAPTSDPIASGTDQAAVSGSSVATAGQNDAASNNAEVKLKAPKLVALPKLDLSQPSADAGNTSSATGASSGGGNGGTANSGNTSSATGASSGGSGGSGSSGGSGNTSSSTGASSGDSGGSGSGSNSGNTSSSTGSSSGDDDDDHDDDDHDDDDHDDDDHDDDDHDDD